MKLVVLDGGQEFDFPLGSGQVIVGRDVKCDLVLRTNSVSRRHVALQLQGDQVVVRDLGSHNGTFIAGAAVQEAVLNEGDTVRVGDARLKLVKGVAQTPAPAPPAKEFHEDEEPTPVDDTFLPAETSGRQPELVARGEEWFVRDSETGREVQIVPVAAQPAQAPAVAAGRNKLLILGGAGVALVVIILLLSLSSDKGSDGSFTPKPRLNVAKVERALDLIQTGNAREGETLARNAADRASNPALAKAVAQLASVWGITKDNFSRWRETFDLLKEIMESPNATSKMKSFADSEIRWILRESRNERFAAEAMEAIGKRDFVAACEKFDKIGSDSLFRKRYAAQIAESRSGLVTGYVRLGEAAEAKQNWREAADAYRKAIEQAKDPADLQERIRKALRNESAKRTVKRARDLLDGGKAASALAALEDMPTGTVYDQEVAAIRRRAESDRKLAEARTAYKRGDGKRALEILAKMDGSDGLRRKIETVMNEHAQAEAAAKVFDYAAAIPHWEMVKAIEDDTDNFYRNRAEINLETWTGDAARAAQKLVAEADEAREREEYKLARDKYEAAMKLDPEHKLGASEIGILRKKAWRLYNEAKNLAAKDPRAARQRLQAVVEMLRADEQPKEHARNMLKELEKK